MSRGLDITAAQQSAVDRADLHGVVYLLSGTLPGKGAFPDATFYWATQPGVVAPLGAGGADVTFDYFLAPPEGIQRGMQYMPGLDTVDPAVRLFVHNLPFAHSESLLAALSDSDFAWENATATLRVGYLGPGQNPSDLAAADWTPLVTSGYFGAPQDLALDGFNVVLYNRGAKRNQVMELPRMPTEETAVGAVDRADAGRMMPIIYGRPSGWIRVLGLNLGVRGFTVSGYTAGDTEIQFRAITVGDECLLSGNAFLDVGVKGNRAGLMVHYRTPVYPVVTGLATYDQDSQIFTVTLESGLAGSVPRGAYVQQYGPALDADGDTIYNAADHLWVMAAQRIYSADVSFLASASGEGKAGWLFPDGTVREVVDQEVWNFRSEAILTEEFGAKPLYHYKSPPAPSAGEVVCTAVAMGKGTVEDPNPPVYYDPGDPNVVKTQPEFSPGTAAQRMTSKMNYPTGGADGPGITGTNANARDGNETTNVGLDQDEYIDLYFDDAPSPFANDDTTFSALHVMVQGDIIFKAGATTIGTTNGTGGVTETFRFIASPAEDYNQTIRCIGDTSGGSVVEVWWEHDLETDINLTRTQDVEIGGQSVSGVVGEVMEYAELVVQGATKNAGWQCYKLSKPNGVPFTSPWAEAIQSEFGGSLVTDACRPTAVMASLQELLGVHTGSGFWGAAGGAPGEGHWSLINQDSYDAAHARFQAEDIRLNFALLDEPSSWTELEQEVARQSRAHMFYGPSGHEILFIEDDTTLLSQSVLASFRLPGCPGANAFQGAGPLMERTPVSDVINVVELGWERDYLQALDTKEMEGLNTESVSTHGRRLVPSRRSSYWMHADIPFNPNYDAASALSGTAQVYADRHAFASTRFTFDTAWGAHRLDRGSVVRVAYQVALDSYRNVLAEVEQVSVSPLNAERRTITARGLGTPTKGLEPAYTWADVFDDDSDQWTDEVVHDYETWSTYWSA